METKADDLATKDHRDLKENSLCSMYYCSFKSSRAAKISQSDFSRKNSQNNLIYVRESSARL